MISLGINLPTFFILICRKASQNHSFVYSFMYLFNKKLRIYCVYDTEWVLSVKPDRNIKIGILPPSKEPGSSKLTDLIWSHLR